MKVLVKQFLKMTLKKEFITTWILMAAFVLLLLVGVFTASLYQFNLGLLGVAACLQKIIIKLQGDYIDHVLNSEDFLDFKALVKEFNEEKEEN